MRILLVNPPKFDTTRFGIANVLDRAISAPIAIGYIAAVLVKAGKKVNCVDMFDWGWEKVENFLRKESFDVIGITCLTDRRPWVFKIVDFVKKKDKKIAVVLGGAHATIMSEQVLTNHPVDVCVRGEGEATIVDLIESFEKKKSLSGVLGISYKEGREVFHNQNRPRIVNLDKIPFPRYDYFSVDDYVVHPSYKGQVVDGVDLGKLKRTSVITSRGCISNCEFCSTRILWGTAWLFRSPKNIVDELELLNKKYGFRHFEIADDCFTVNRKRVKEICREMIKRKLDILWFCETRVDCVDSAMLNLMRKAGCYVIAYGVETGDKKLMKSIGKGVTLESVEKAVSLTKKAGIRVQMYLMVGNHNESEGSIESTIKLVKKTEPDEFPVSVTRVYPGTRLYQVACKKGFMDDSYWLTDKPAPYYTAEQDLKTLRVWVSKISSLNQKVALWKRVLRPVRNIILEKTGLWFSRQYK